VWQNANTERRRAASAPNCVSADTVKRLTDWVPSAKPFRQLNGAILPKRRLGKTPEPCFALLPLLEIASAVIFRRRFQWSSEVLFSEPSDVESDGCHGQFGCDEAAIGLQFERPLSLGDGCAREPVTRLVYPRAAWLSGGERPLWKTGGEGSLTAPAT
jgi:hypothetical protein